jgi:hypothetical protein
LCREKDSDASRVCGGTRLSHIDSHAQRTSPHNTSLGDATYTTRRASTGQRAPKYPTPRRPTCTGRILEVRGASVDAQSALKRARTSLQKQLICVLALLPVPGSVTIYIVTRGLHSSTFQLNMSRVLSISPPTDPSYPTKLAYVEPRSGRVRPLGCALGSRSM